MQHYRPALSWHRRRTNRRGAVFLLAVYFASLMLLVLSGIALQRTMMETRAAQLSRDGRQAFYLAEGVLDHALQRQAERLPDGVYDVPEMPGGSFALTTTEARVVSETMPGGAVRHQSLLTREIIANGSTSSGMPAEVQGTVPTQEPLRGVWSNSVIVAFGSPGSGGSRSTLYADLYSNLGVAGSIQLQGALNLVGSANVGAPRDAEEEFESIEFREAWRELFGEDLTINGIAALQTLGIFNSIETVIIGGKVETQTSTSQAALFTPTVTGTVSSITSVGQIRPIPSPYPAAQCQAAIVVGMGSGTMVMSPDNGDQIPHYLTGWGGMLIDMDELGYVHPDAPPSFGEGIYHLLTGVEDLSPPGDGRTVLCVPYVDVADGDLIFHGPTTLYVTSSVANEDNDSPSAGYAVRVGGGGYIVAVNPNGQVIPDGVQLIVTEVNGPQAGRVSIKATAFSGSIFAPQSPVLVSISNRDSSGGWSSWSSCRGSHCSDDAPMGSIVGREVGLLVSGSLDVRGDMSESNNAEDEEGAAPLVSWTNGTPPYRTGAPEGVMVLNGEGLEGPSDVTVMSSDTSSGSSGSVVVTSGKTSADISL